jgi:hypothetical protein
MHLEKCPVCEGRGHVPQGFYLDITQTTGTNQPVLCRSCFGVGYILVKDLQYVPTDTRVKTYTGDYFENTCGTTTSPCFTVLSGSIESNN